jgi:hypothetical protein
MKKSEQAVPGNRANANVFSEFSPSVDIVFFFIDFSC